MPKAEQREQGRTIRQQRPRTFGQSAGVLWVRTANQMLWRYVRGRSISVVTGAVRAWLAMYVTAHGKRARLRIWDNASWHVSQAVEEWIKVPNRQAKQERGCRTIVCRLPGKSLWLHDLEDMTIFRKEHATTGFHAAQRPWL